MFEAYDDLITIKEFDSEIITCVFQWATYFHSNQNNDAISLENDIIDIIGIKSIGIKLNVATRQNTSDRFDDRELIVGLYKFEFDLFQLATKFQKLNLFELVKAADYWDIPRLTSSLALYIVYDVVSSNMDVEQIYLCLFKSKVFIPSEFAPRVLYLLLLKRHIASNCFFNVCSNVSTVYIQRSIDFGDFVFLYSIENSDFIKYDYCHNEQLMSCMSYQDTGFSIQKQQKVRDIMSAYLDKEDLKESIVSGGIFWDYKNESHFALAYPCLFEVYKASQDVDIFILDDDEHERYIHYIYKMKNNFNKSFQNIKKMEIEDETDYDVNSFKIIEPDGLVVNFIFVNKYNYASLPAMLLETFDYSLVKTFYSFKCNALYMPVEIFNQYEFMCKQFGLVSRRVDVFSQTNSNASFVFYKRLLCELLNFDFSFPEKSKKNIMGFLEIKREEFCSEFDYSLKCISKFLRRSLPRIIKYGFKNGFVREEDSHLVLERINLFYQIFGHHLVDKYFAYTNEEIFDCILKYILKTNNLSLIFN